MKRPLAALATYDNGFPFKPTDLSSTGTPVIRIRQLVDREADVDRHPGSLPDRYVIENDDLIFSWSGSLAVRFWDRGTAYLNQHLFRVSPVSGVDKRWLGHVLVASLDRLDGLMHGSAMTHITKPMLKMVEWDVPAIEEQRRIADFLDDRVSRIDRIIAARRQQEELAAAYQRAQLSEIMDRQAGRAGLAPMRRFCAGIEQGSSPIAEDRPADASGAGVLKTSSVFRGEFFPDRHKAIDPATADARHVVRGGDVIVIRGSGSPELVGDAATAQVRPNGPVLLLSDLTYRLRGLHLVPDYAVLALISDRGRSELISLVRQGSGPAKARGDDILSISVPIATLGEQRRCVATASKFREQWTSAVSSLNGSIVLLTEYKSSLITAAVTGELDVTTAGSNIPG